MAGPVQVRRAYEEARESDGRRILVDRVWPRGLSKDHAHLDEWCKQVAPSPELRKWYGHDPLLFEEFARRYRRELEDAEHAEALAHLRSVVEAGPMTLLTGAKRSDISQASVLADLLADSGKSPRVTGD